MRHRLRSQDPMVQLPGPLKLVEVLGPEGGASPIEPGREVVVLGAPALSDGARVAVAGAKKDPVANEPEDASGERS